MSDDPRAPTDRAAARPRLRRFAHDERGAVAVLYALMLPVLIGFLSLAVEVGIWYDVRRQAQNAADSAATAAAFAKANNGSDTLAKAVATRDAKRNGWDAAAGAITINIPPTSGALKGSSAAAEVIVRKDVELLLSAYFLGDGKEGIAARAVGTWSPSGAGAGACIIALDTSAGDAIHIYNNAMVTNSNCGLISNSSSSMAIHLDNNSMAAGPVSVVGRYLLQNNATLTNKNLVQGAAPVADPYAGIVMPVKPACTSQTWQMTNTGTINLSPGHFCQGWNFANNVTVNLAPGVYYLDQAVNIQNNVWVNGTGGVTLVLGGNFNVNIGNNAYLNLNAPTSGPFQGIVMTTYSGATTGIVQNFANNSFLTINGALYFPTQDLTLQNNAATNSSNCTQIVARRISLTNNVVLGTNGCLAAGVKGTYPGQSAPLLAE